MLSCSSEREADEATSFHSATNINRNRIFKTWKNWEKAETQLKYARHIEK
jgi:hypothetical protein